MNNDRKSDVKSDNKELDINSTYVDPDLFKQLFLIALAVFGGMLFYEFLKTYFLPTLSIWGSHFITIIFSTVLATLTAYVILKQHNELLGEITNKRDRYKRALEKVALSEKKLQEVFNNANDMITLNLMEDAGLPGNFIEVNEIGIERLGYSRDEFLNMTPSDIVALDKQSEMPKNALKLFNKGYAEFEIIHQAKNGKRIPVEVNNHIFELDGKKVVIAVSRDITERKQAEELLKNSEMKYRKIFDNVQDVFYQTDMQGNIIEISPSIERYSGYKRDELIGKPVDMFYFDPEDRNHFLKEIQEKGEVSDYEIKLKTKNEGLLYTSNNAHFLLDSNKKPMGIEGSLRDINDRKEMEKELRWRENRLKIGMDIAKLVYWEYDMATDMFTFDDQFYTLYGTTVDEEGGNQMSSEEYATRFVPPEEQAAVGVEVAKAVESYDPNYESSMQHWIIRGDGERRYLIVRIRLKFDENGRKIGHRGVNQDITEQKMAEDALKEADRRLGDIIEFLPDATFVIDVNGKVISWNRAIKEMTQINPEEILGKDNYEYALKIYGKRRPMLIDMVNLSEDEIQKKYGNYEKRGNVLTAETEFSLSGEVRTFWIKAVPFLNLNGDYIGAIEVLEISLI